MHYRMLPVVPFVLLTRDLVADVRYTIDATLKRCDAHRAGYDLGYRAGYADGRRVGRPVLVAPVRVRPGKRDAS